MIVGNSCVGKTSLLLTYSSKAFPGEYLPSMPFDGVVPAMVDNEFVSLSLWDTQG